MVKEKAGANPHATRKTQEYAEWAASGVFTIGFMKAIGLDPGSDPDVLFFWTTVGRLCLDIALPDVANKVRR